MAYTEREGVAGIALLAMYADGVIVQVEDEVLRERLLQYPLFSDLDEDGLSEVLVRMEAETRARGEEAMMAACAAAIGPWLRPTAYLVAAEIVVADDDVAPEETDYLARLRKTLGLDEAQAKPLLEAVAIRARR